jgi:hypothetical protein
MSRGSTHSVLVVGETVVAATGVAPPGSSVVGRRVAARAAAVEEGNDRPRKCPDN